MRAGGALTTAAQVTFPATYDLVWTTVLGLLVVAVVWALVTVLRSSLSDRAKALWCVLLVVLPVVSVVAWAVLGRGARRPTTSASGPSGGSGPSRRSRG